MAKSFHFGRIGVAQYWAGELVRWLLPDIRRVPVKAHERTLFEDNEVGINS